MPIGFAVSIVVAASIIAGAIGISSLDSSKTTNPSTTLNQSKPYASNPISNLTAIQILKNSYVGGMSNIHTHIVNHTAFFYLKYNATYTNQWDLVTPQYIMYHANPSTLAIDKNLTYPIPTLGLSSFEGDNLQARNDTSDKYAWQVTTFINQFEGSDGERSSFIIYYVDAMTGKIIGWMYTCPACT